MITGDDRQVADAVADQLGIDEVFAEVLPQRKDTEVAELQARGHRVAMVGDGVMSCPPEAARRQDTGLRPDRGRFAHPEVGVRRSRDRYAARPRGMLDLRWPVPGAQPFHVHEGTPRSASPAPGAAGWGHVVVVGCRPRLPAARSSPGLTALPGLERAVVVLPGTPPPGWNGAPARGRTCRRKSFKYYREGA